MEKIKITFLGTGDAVPTKTRNHTAILINYKNEGILLDCGEGTQRQIKKADINPCKINTILITHLHGDHVFGLPGLLKTLSLHDCNHKIKIYGPKGTKNYFSTLRKIMNFDIPIEINEVTNEKFLETNEFFIEASSMSHTIPSNAYSFVIKEKRRINKEKLKKYKLPQIPLLKNLQQGKDIIFQNKKIKASNVTYIEKGKKVTFILDTEMNSNTIKIAKNSDVLIIESQFLEEERKKAEKHKHLTLNDSINIAKKAKVKKLILTHISQRYENNLPEIEKQARKMFKNSALAKDFDVIEI